MRYETINNFDIANHYTIDGWYLLWYLMAHANQAQYIRTTIEFISVDINIKPTKIKDILTHLHNKGEIFIRTFTLAGKEKSVKKITNKEILEITIGYSNPEIKQYEKQGYKPIPVDFARSVIPTLDPIAWAIYSVLVVRYSFFSTLEPRRHKDTGKIIYPYTINGYAFSTQRQIGELLGISDYTVKKYIEKLVNECKFYLVYIKNNSVAGMYTQDDSGKIKTINYQYGINLLERLEYQYYFTINIEDKRDDKIKQLVKNNRFHEIIGTENQYCLNNKDYLLDLLPESFNQYDEAIKNKNNSDYIKWYKECKFLNIRE